MHGPHVRPAKGEQLDVSRFAMLINKDALGENL